MLRDYMVPALAHIHDKHPARVALAYARWTPRERTRLHEHMLDDPTYAWGLAMLAWLADDAFLGHPCPYPGDMPSR